MEPIPKTMKAWVVAKNAQPGEGLQLKADYPAPGAPTGSNILVRISYAALNPADVHLMLNLPLWIPFRRNPIPGMDFAGEIVAAGPNVPADLAVGTEVCGALTVSQIAVGKGSMAEYVLIPADSVAARPKSLPLAAAAGVMGIAGQTAHIMEKSAQLKKGDRVLINGASGGVGTLLVQIAKAKGAVVTGICSEANIALVKGLGADEVVDYKAHDPLEVFLAEQCKEEPFNYVFDTVGSQPLYRNSPKYLKPEGRFISIAGGKSQGIVPVIKNNLIPTFLGGTPRTFRLLGLAPAGSIAKEAAKLVEDGSIKNGLIDSEFAFEEVPAAYEKLETKRAKGKIVVKVRA
ncbi:NAD(P)-binding protein [Thozetella sp. PMI_491]|nr:NAD(P)-binding protein [Thozetella sp. PMI_491]